MTKPAPHLITFVLLTALTVISTTMFLPALPAMQSEFGVNEATIGLSVTAYMIAAAGLQLLLGPLSDRVGRRPVIVSVLSIYAASSLVCVFAQDIVVFLAARTVQAVAMTAGILVAAMVRDLFDGPMAAAKLATISSAMAIVPMMAPVLGGFLDVQFGWRSIFVFYALTGAGLLIWVLRDLAETRPDRTAETPERRRMLLREARFWAFAFCQALGAGGFYVFLVGSPFVAAALYGLDSGQIGIGLGSVTMGFMAASALSARTVHRFGPFRLIVVGRLASLLGLGAGFVVFSITTPPVWVFYAVTIWVGVGNGLTLANANALALAVRPRLAGTASGICGALGNLVIAAMSMVTTITLADEASATRLLLLLMGVVGASLFSAILGHRLDRGQGQGA
ncbi:multidrug effflux MFS transporter [Thalassococcus lentus]|uniref:Bcr/CflA family efflux transporter n=1 Tax=Thalassococcus lentus TaxID=1210524 RepID=A0ABT4XRW4_9RHOB|nr:multidrug effflux MFS transporter [Thalassococcus lentus]MDA7424688.1 multidrug effflux MFS transporter [Thalassococcus lentus]